MLGIRGFVGVTSAIRSRLRAGVRCRRDALFAVARSTTVGAQLPLCCSRFKYTVSYVHGHDHYPMGPALIAKTFGRVVDETTEKYPNSEFVVFPEVGERRTFHEFREEMDRLAAGLLSIGVERGDRVGIWGPNSVEWVLTMFAAARIGAILVNLNPAYQMNEIEYALNKVGVKTIVASGPFKTQNYYDMLADICPELETATPGQLQSKRLPSLKSVITMGSEQHPGSLLFNDVKDMGRPEHNDIIEGYKKTLQFDDVANIQFTSGTTGQPKATCLTHFNIQNNLVILDHMIKSGGPDKTWCLPLPLFHTGGMSMVALGMLYGHKTVFPSAGFDATMCLRALQNERCTHFGAVPTMLIDILNQPDFSTYDLSSMEGVISGGSDVPPELRRRAAAEFNTKIEVVYGMTEATLDVTASLATDPEATRKTTVGRVGPWTEVKITDPSTNEIVPVNSSGEICVRSPCVMTEYWDDEEKTKETVDAARWLHTGDLGEMDEDGFITIVGRSKDIIIRGGENIMPVLIEQLLHTHPKVADVQVVGVPDERMIEELCACVKLKPGEECTENEIRNFCKGKISHYMVPRYVQFIDSFPLTTSGKIQKFKVREEMTTRLNLA